MVGASILSRYCRGRFTWDLDKASPDESLERLVRIARKAGRPCVLIPTTDSQAMFVDEHAESLREHFMFALPRHPLTRSLCSKREMQQTAEQWNVPTARTVFPATRTELMEYADTMMYPVFVKSSRPLDGKLRGSKFILRNLGEMEQFAGDIQESQVGNLIVQEFIPAGEGCTDWMFNGYFNDRSECLAGFTGFKIRQCPVGTGVTSLGECRQNDEIQATARQFLQGIQYRGIVDMDFRYDSRDQKYKLLDINPRVGGTFRLFASKQGFDMVRALYLDLTGQEVIAQAPEDGRRWMVEDFDMVSAWCSYRASALNFRQWSGSLSGVSERAFTAWDDPLPVLAMLWADGREFFQRGASMLSRRLVSHRPIAQSSRIRILDKDPEH